MGQAQGGKGAIQADLVLKVTQLDGSMAGLAGTVVAQPALWPQVSAIAHGLGSCCSAHQVAALKQSAV
jgi:hypothetical protein